MTRSVTETPGAIDRVPASANAAVEIDRVESLAPGHPAGPVELLEFLRRHIPAPPADVVPQVVLRPGLTVVRAEPRAGSAMVLNLALARSAGEPWLGRPTAPGRTLILTVTAEYALKGQFRTMRRALTRPSAPDSVFLESDRGVTIDTPAGAETLQQTLERTRVDLLIVDSALRIRTGPMIGFVRALDALIQTQGLAVVVTHHRGGGRETSTLLDAAERVVSLERDGAGWMVEVGSPAGPAAIDRLPIIRTKDLWFAPFTVAPAGAAGNTPPPAAPATRRA